MPARVPRQSNSLRQSPGENHRGALHTLRQVHPRLPAERKGGAQRAPLRGNPARQQGKTARDSQPRPLVRFGIPRRRPREGRRRPARNRLLLHRGNRRGRKGGHGGIRPPAADQRVQELHHFRLPRRQQDDTALLPAGTEVSGSRALSHGRSRTDAQKAFPRRGDCLHRAVHRKKARSGGKRNNRRRPHIRGFSGAFCVQKHRFEQNRGQTRGRRSLQPREVLPHPPRHNQVV